MHRLAGNRISSRFIEKQSLTQWISTSRGASAAASEAAVAAENDSSASTKKFVIPKRVDRTPICLLRALSQTVKPDPTLPHYKFIDDPFLLPESVGQRLMYALSQESGRKTAKWIVKEHADCFNVRWAFKIEWKIRRIDEFVMKTSFSPPPNR